VLLPHPNDPFSNERDREKKRFNLIDNFGPSIVSAAIFKWKRKNIIISSGVDYIFSYFSLLLE
jgi:hypothetical protein